MAANIVMSAEAAFTGPVLLIAANVGAARDHQQAARMERLERTVLDRLDALEKRMAPPAELPVKAPKASRKKASV